MKKNRPFFVNKYVLPPILYVRSQILYPLFNYNEATRLNFRVKIVHLIAYIKSKVFSFNNKKVDVFIVGGQKCGTTALHNYLIKHPKIISGKIKELHFFDYEPYFDKENIIKSPMHLRALFQRKIPEDSILIDSTPNYSWWENSINRIYNYNKNAKLIFIMRNPVQRALSHWNMQYDLKISLKSFRDSYNQELRGDTSRELSYISRGFYSKQIKKMFNIFGRKNVQILESKDLKENTNNELLKISNFLNIDKKDFSVEKIVNNSRAYHSKLEEIDKVKLIKIFTPEIRELERLLKKDFSHWINF
tara:strand:+ start:2395 stop:3306 length:912 start_codon:yes stop_codon:yes gene_type:complete